MRLIKQSLTLSVFIFSILPLFIGCTSQKPSDSVVKELLTEGALKSVPGSWIGSAVSRTKDVRITSVEIREWGNYNKQEQYWAVRIRVVGSAIAIGIVEMGRHNFDEIADYKISKDDYGKWKIVLAR